MVRLYQLGSDLSEGYLQGRREHYVPPVLCPACGMTGCYSIDLPCVDVDKAGIKIPGKPVPPEVFAELKKQLQPLYPAGFPVQKSQGLGLLKAEARGKLNDLIGFVGAGLCCFKKEKLKELNRSGIEPIQSFPVHFSPKSAWFGKIVEGQIQGLVSFGNTTHPKGEWKECPHCGWHDMRSLDASKICIKKSSVPQKGDFFGVRQWGQIMIVTERFKECAKNILRNANFTEVTVVDE